MRSRSYRAWGSVACGEQRAGPPVTACRLHVVRGPAEVRPLLEASCSGTYRTVTLQNYKLMILL